MQITDNGTNPVTVIKKGPGSIKLDGHNTFSGGFYILEGRVQYAGSEPSGGTANTDGGGTGPLYIFPGSYWFPSGASATHTNAIFMGGLGDSAEPIGTIRCGGTMLILGKVTLISNARIGSSSGNATVFGGQITGPYSLDSVPSPPLPGPLVCPIPSTIGPAPPLSTPAPAPTAVSISCATSPTRSFPTAWAMGMLSCLATSPTALPFGTSTAGMKPSMASPLRATPPTATLPTKAQPLLPLSPWETTIPPAPSAVTSPPARA